MRYWLKWFLLSVSFLTFSVTLFLSGSLASVSSRPRDTSDAVELSPGDDAFSQYGYEVNFPGLSERVRVFPLRRALVSEKASGKLAVPEDIIGNIRQARERNARWLISERRPDSMAVSLTLKVAYPNGKTKEYPYTGRYSRGVFLVPPAEYMLYYADLRTYSYSEDEDYFRVVRRRYRGASDGVPAFSMAGGLAAHSSAPPSWLTVSDLMWFGRWESNELQPGHELYFSKDDFRLIREISTFETDGPSPIGRIQADYYYSHSPYPRRVVIKTWHENYPDLSTISILVFRVVSNLWFIDEAVIGAKLSPKLEQADVDIKHVRDAQMGGTYLKVASVRVRQVE